MNFTEISAQSGLNRRAIPMVTTHTPARVISVTSGKGGVGKTLTTVNLGLGLVKLGHKVLLLDADLGLANINIMLGFQPQTTLHEVFTGNASLSDIIVQHPLGFDVIPASSGITEVTHLDEVERIHLVDSFDSLAQRYDYLLIDTAAGIGSNVLYFNVAAEQIIVVIDHEPTSITDAYALIKVLATEWDTKEFDIVVNRTPPGSDGRRTFAKLASAADHFLPVKLNYLGSIAEDSSVSEAIVKQTPILQLFPGTRASRDLTKLAQSVNSSKKNRNPKGGLQFFFRSLLDCKDKR